MILIIIFMFFHKRVKKPISRIVSFFLLGIIVFASTTKDVEALAGPYTVTDLGHSECAAE